MKELVSIVAVTIVAITRLWEQCLSTKINRLLNVHVMDEIR